MSAVNAVKKRRAEEAVRRDEREAAGLPAELEMPEDFKCQIGKLVMVDPVVAADGFSYERANIERWLQSASADHRTLPLGTYALK